MRRPDAQDDGAAVVEFVLVVGFLLLPLFLGLLQVGLIFHARNVIVASAAAGARVGANVDSTAEKGAQDACRRIADSLSRVPAGISCVGGYVTGAGGVELVEVRVSGPVPMFFLPLGHVDINVAGHAVREFEP
jgi:Flp pilus assembly protein TadG